MMVLGLILVSLLFYLFSFIRSRKSIFDNSLPGLSSFLLICSLGIGITFLSIPQNQPEHYIHKNSGQDRFLAEGVITEELKPGLSSSRFIVNLRKINSEDTLLRRGGKILLNLKTDTVSNTVLQPGASILFHWNPKPIKAPLNPFQFDYRAYMQKQKVHSQLSLNQSQIKVLKQDENYLRAKAWDLREQLILQLKKRNFSSRELAVLQALILGQKRDLDDELYRNYAAAGAIHILAISGLHIGILLLLFSYLLKPMERLRKGRILKTALIICLLWSFAFLTGLSPSVVRAVTMFSFISIGMQMNKKTSSLNAVFLSLFFLLIIDPYLIFQVGFQLSYLAVLSIILFQPVIYGFFIQQNKLFDYFWKLISVSLAAQIGVLPLSLFYFHQFPGLFLISNIIILPGLGIILTTGLLVFILAYLDILPGFLAKLLETILRTMNLIIEKISGVESLVYSNIPFSLPQTILAYLIIVGIILLSVKISFKRLLYILACVLSFQASVIYHKLEIPSEEFLVLNSYGKSLIVHKTNSAVKVMSDSISEELIPKDYLRERQVTEPELSSLPKIIGLEDLSVLVIDTVMNHQIPGFKPEILLLRKNAKVNLGRLIHDLKPQVVIADGSNTRYYIEKWKKTAQKEEIPFHHTGEKGAYILRTEEGVSSLKRYPEILPDTSATHLRSSLFYNHR